MNKVEQAGFSRRLGAAIIDAVILQMVVALVATMFLGSYLVQLPDIDVPASSTALSAVTFAVMLDNLWTLPIASYYCLGFAGNCPKIWREAATNFVQYVLLIQILANFAYHVFFESSPWQATPGKRVLGLLVQNASGGPIGPLKAAIRHVLKVVSTAIFCVGYLMIWVTPKQQGLHDFATGCYVVHREARGKNAWTALSAVCGSLLYFVFVFASLMINESKFQGKTLILDTSGKQVSSLKTLPAIPESSAPEDPLPIKIVDLYGFKDKRGKIVIPAEYKWVNSFSEGYAVVRRKDDKGFRVIDKTGATVCPPKFADIRSFSEGLAEAKLDLYGKWGFIGPSGNAVIPFEFDEVQRFSNGLAAVGYSAGCAEWDDDRTQSHLWGYIDKKGEFVIKPQYRSAMPFKNGMAEVSY